MLDLRESILHIECVSPTTSKAEGLYPSELKGGQVGVQHGYVWRPFVEFIVVDLAIDATDAFQKPRAPFEGKQFGPLNIYVQKLKALSEYLASISWSSVLVLTVICPTWWTSECS